MAEEECPCLECVNDRYMKAQDDKIKALELQVEAWKRAVNAWCSCGGKGPDDGACVACLVYHQAQVRIE